MRVNITDKEQNKIALMNVGEYDSKTNYIRASFIGVETDEEASEEFIDQIENGYIQEITCGTYNGATDTFTPWTLTDRSILDTILNALHDEDFYNFVAMYNDDPDELKELEKWSNADWIREYTDVYEVFIIDGKVYVNQD